MSTTIRVLADFIIQLAIIIFFLLFIANNFEYYWAIGGIFAAAISSWQLSYGFYMVKKHNDWQKKAYLKQIKQIAAYAIFFVFVTLLIYLLSWGFLYDFIQFMVEILYLIFATVLTVFSFLEFINSFKKLYFHYFRNQSFWDIK